jgi:multiple sugar transport system permease protein
MASRTSRLKRFGSRDRVSSWDRAILSHSESRTVEGRLIYGAIIVFLLLLSIVVIVPFVYAFASGLKESREIFAPTFTLFPNVPNWGNYERAWGYFNLPRLFANSLVVVVGGLISQLGVSVLAAYSLSRLKPIGGRLLMLGFMVTLMIPGIAYIIPLYVTAKRLGLLGGYGGLWFSYGVNAFMIFVMKNFFDSLPNELFDAAKVDGASAFQIFWRIALPLTRPLLIVMSILTFVNLWKDFLWPYLVLLDKPELQPVSVFLFLLEERSATPPNIQMAGYFMAMLPPLIIALVLQRYMQRGLSIGAVKG